MINYKGTPLFGPDSSAQHTSEFFAIAGTILFWILFLIFSFVIKPQPKKPEYKEVQIVLSSTPVVQKTEESPAPAEQAAAPSAAASAQVEEAPVSPIVETPAPKAQPKPTPKKTEPAKTSAQPKSSTPKEPAKYGKTNEELMAEQFANRTTKPVSNEDFDNMFDDANENFSDQQSPNKVTTNNTFSGEMGRVEKDSNVPIISKNTSEVKNNSVSNQSAIDNVRKTSEIPTDNLTGEGKAPTPTNGNNKDSIVWTEGNGKRTVYSFDATLSEEARNSMYVSKATPFTITFSVDADGNVLRSSINISNDFILTDLIKNEMIKKVSAWKFGKGSGISKASFSWVLVP